jgi:hypothetical protein
MSILSQVGLVLRMFLIRDTELAPHFAASTFAREAR